MSATSCPVICCQKSVVVRDDRLERGDTAAGLGQIASAAHDQPRVGEAGAFASAVQRRGAERRFEVAVDRRLQRTDRARHDRLDRIVRVADADAFGPQDGAVSGVGDLHHRDRPAARVADLAGEQVERERVGAAREQLRNVLGLRRQHPDARQGADREA
jgi:hypothetical protein